MVQQDCRKKTVRIQVKNKWAFGLGGLWRAAKFNYQEMPKTELRTRTKTERPLKPTEITDRNQEWQWRDL